MINENARFQRERRSFRPSKESWNHRERLTPYGAAYAPWEDGADRETISQRMEDLANGFIPSTLRIIIPSEGIDRIAPLSDYRKSREADDTDTPQEYSAPAEMPETARLGAIAGMDWFAG